MRTGRRRRVASIVTAWLLAGCGGCANNEALPFPTAAQPCPAWTEFPADRNSNGDARYLGCSNAVNLRAMVDDPSDLEKGRLLGPADGERTARAIEAYHQAIVRPSAATSSSGTSAAAPGASASAPP